MRHVGQGVLLTGRCGWKGKVGERDEWKFRLGVRARGAKLCILHEVMDYSTWWWPSKCEHRTSIIKCIY
jgi:hypothetical protein